MTTTFKSFTIVEAHDGSFRILNVSGQLVASATTLDAAKRVIVQATGRA